MDERTSLNAVLLIDAAGCFIGSGLFLISTTAWGWTDLPDSWRLPVVIALFAFSTVLVIIARYKSRATIAMAVLGNIVWIAAGAIALFVTGTVLGSLVIGLIMVADALMAWMQARPLLNETMMPHATTPNQMGESGS